MDDGYAMGVLGIRLQEKSAIAMDCDRAEF